MSIDSTDLVLALRGFRDRGGAWVDLERATQKAGHKVSAPTIMRTANGTTEPSPRTWEALYRARPDIIPPPPWVVDQGRETRIDSRDQAEVLSVDIIEIPVFDAGAGEPAGWTDGGYPVGEAGEFLLIPADMADENTFAVTLHGDSMEPYLSEGDKVVVVPSAELVNGKLCFISWPQDGDKMVKRFYKYGETIVLRSDNPDHEEITLDESNGIGVNIYRVTQSIRRE